MGSSYFPDAYGGGRLDFSGIASLGDSIGGAIGDYRQKSRIKSAWDEAGGDYNVAVQKLLAAGDVKAAAAVNSIAHGSLDGVHGTPIWGRDTQTGKEGVGVIARDGSFRLLDTEGFQPERGVTIEDTGLYGRLPVSKGSGRPVGPAIPQTGDIPSGFNPGAPPPLPGYPYQQGDGGVAPATAPGELPVYGEPQQQGPSAGVPGVAPLPASVQPPPGYMPGTEQARKEAEAAQTEQDRQTNQQLTADVVTEDIGRARKIINGDSLFPAYGISGALTKAIPQTPAHDVAGLLDGIKANISFDKLQKMRDASKTGGALGQVSDFENRLLQSVYGSLVQSQTKQQLDFNLRRLDNIYKRIINKGIKPGDPIDGDGSTSSPNDPLGLR